MGFRGCNDLCCPSDVTFTVTPKMKILLASLILKNTKQKRRLGGEVGVSFSWCHVACHKTLKSFRGVAVGADHVEIEMDEL